MNPISSYTRHRLFGALSIMLLIAPSTAIFATSNSIQDLLSKGQRAYTALSFDDAIVAYQKALEVLEESPQTDEHIQAQLTDELLFRIAEAHYAAGQFPQMIEVLTCDRTLPDRSLQLLALAYKQQSKHAEAIRILEKLSIKGSVNPEVRWHLAHAQYLSGDVSAAKALFQTFTLSNSSSHLYLLSQLYLTRIDLSQSDFEKARHRLEEIAALSSKDPLRYEWSYLFGEVYFLTGDPENAAPYYESALPNRNLDKVSWASNSLQQLARCYLQLADNTDVPQDQRVIYLDKAYEAISSLKAFASSDDVHLTLGRYYVIKGRRFGDEDSLEQAEKLLSQPNLFQSRDSIAQALLLRAEAAASYADRDTLYRRLTDLARSSGSYYAQSWFLRGINDLDEADRLLANGAKTSATLLYDSAAYALTQAFELAESTDPALSGNALTKAIKAYANADTDRSVGQAISLLTNLPKRHPQVIAAAEHPDEFLYLQAWLGAQKPHYFQRSGTPDTTDGILEQLLDQHPQGQFAPAAAYLLATRNYRKGNYALAKQFFSLLHTAYPHSTYSGDACYWHARCLETMENTDPEYRVLLATVFQQYPQATTAAEAYFSFYASSDYLLGNPDALHHLEKMPDLFPNSPYVVNALLLTGLDYKRSRLSEEGKIIRKRNWNRAIEAFQTAEARFDTLYEKGLIPSEDLGIFVAVRYRSILERSLTNLSIATESEGPKKHIYLEYAIDMFQKLVAELQGANHPLATLVARGESHAPLLEEASYGLTLAQIQASDDAAATKTLNQMLARYQTAKITRGYYLSRVQYQKALIAMRADDPKNGLDLLSASEVSAKGKVLSTEEKLDLWIQRSQCYRQLNQLDNAMLELSRVINDDAISALRVKAMFLRAEVYELQERPELAQKQLEATAKKGGRWALMAKEKLDRDYRYD